MNTRVMIPDNVILTAATLLQAKQAAQDAMVRKIAHWMPRVDDEAQSTFIAAMQRFDHASVLAAEQGRMDMMDTILDHISSYRPPLTKEQALSFKNEALKFAKHLRAVVEKEHPYKTKEYNAISLPYQMTTLQFLRFLDVCVAFKDLNMFEEIKQRWNDIAVAWKKELDEKLPLPTAEL